MPFHKTLALSSFETTLGPMLVAGDEHGICLLEFFDGSSVASEIERLEKRTKSTLIKGEASSIRSIKAELDAYFKGTLTVFKTALHLIGTDFQITAWKELTRTPHGQTRSYADQATAIGRPSACRAVANANGANQIAIVIPCHRIINSNGNLGGYAGGIARKQWLLNHERCQRIGSIA